MSVLMEYPVTIRKLEEIYKQAYENAEKQIVLYELFRKRWRNLSLFSGWTAFIALGFGIVLPLITTNTLSVFSFDLGEPARVGYGFLVVAGLLFGADKIFLYSNSWVRARSSALKIELLKDAFEYDFYKLRTMIPNDETAQDKSDEVLDLCKQFEKDVKEAVKEEIETWATELQQGRQHLGEMIKQAKSEVQETVEVRTKEIEERRNAQEPGAVEVNIDNHSRLTGEITLQVGTSEEKRDFPCKTVVFEEIPPGQRKVVLRGTRRTNNEPINIEQLVTVQPGEPVTARLTVLETQAPAGGGDQS